MVSVCRPLMGVVEKTYFSYAISKEDESKLSKLNQEAASLQSKYMALAQEVYTLGSHVPQASLFSFFPCGAPVTKGSGDSFMSRLFSRYIAPLIAFCTRGAYCSENLKVFGQKSRELKQLEKSINSVNSSISSVEDIYKNRVDFLKGELKKVAVGVVTDGITSIKEIYKNRITLLNRASLNEEFKKGAVLAISAAVVLQTAEWALGQKTFCTLLQIGIPAAIAFKK